MSSEKALPARQATPDIEGLRAQLSSLGLDFAAAALGDLLTDAAKADESGPGLLGRLLEHERSQREERRIRTSLKLSGLPTGQTISGFDFSFQPSVERSRIETLATCGWIREKQSLLILGPPGVGKTHLAIALGVRAIECGLSAAYYRVEELMHAMRQDAAKPPARLRRAKYMKPAMLIVDEMGFDPFSREEAALFFRLVSYRYGRGAICITSNKAINEWPEMLAGDEAITSAILDRLLHSSCVLSIKGRSYRLRDLEASLAGR